MVEVVTGLLQALPLDQTTRQMLMKFAQTPSGELWVLLATVLLMGAVMVAVRRLLKTTTKTAKTTAANRELDAEDDEQVGREGQKKEGDAEWVSDAEE